MSDMLESSVVITPAMVVVNQFPGVNQIGFRSTGWEVSALGRVVLGSLVPWRYQLSGKWGTAGKLPTGHHLARVGRRQLQVCGVYATCGAN